MKILVTNDDGIHAPGLDVAERIARELSEDVWVVAPEMDNSGVAHSLTLSDPIRLRQAGERRFAVRGTPTDCVIMAYKEIIGEQELRKYPYHFEIEMKIVGNLNAMLKRNFRKIVRKQVDEVFVDLVKRVHDALEKVRELAATAGKRFAVRRYSVVAELPDADPSTWIEKLLYQSRSTAA